MQTSIQILVDNIAEAPWVSEHGLSLWIQYAEKNILFDTASGEALFPNLATAGVDLSAMDILFLSHGHYDHTGNVDKVLEAAPQMEVVCASDIGKVRYSLHPGKAPHDLTLPDAGQQALATHSKVRRIDEYCELSEGIYTSGVIPQLSFEDCGGPFFLDTERRAADDLADERALLLGDGTLIQGCCHRGIINTIEHFKKCCPRVKVRTVVGGLHLLYASEERLQKTVEYLNAQQLERLVLMHCTGSNAVDFMRKNMNCPVELAQTGMVLVF